MRTLASLLSFLLLSLSLGLACSGVPYFPVGLGLFWPGVVVAKFAWPGKDKVFTS
jgi:hypothetical protein